VAAIGPQRERNDNAISQPFCLWVEPRFQAVIDRRP